jgi:hypothetical protein
MPTPLLLTTGQQRDGTGRLTVAAGLLTQILTISGVTDLAAVHIRDRDSPA